MGRHVVDLVGKRFGRYLVLGPISGNSLQSGDSKSKRNAFVFKPAGRPFGRAVSESSHGRVCVPPATNASRIRAALKALGLPSDATRSEMEKAFKVRLRAHHPDIGGNPERTKELIAARKLLRKVLPGKGRPRKYAAFPPGYAIKDRKKKDAIYREGFKRKRDAEAALRKLLEAHPELRIECDLHVVSTTGCKIIDRNDDNKVVAEFNSRSEAKEFVKKASAQASAQSLSSSANETKHVPDYRIVGNAAAERQREKRLKDKKKAKDEARKNLIYVLSPNAGMSAGKYMTSAPHGRGLLVTGGYDSTKVSAVDAAWRSHLGGMDEGTNRVPARPVNLGGNGPDAFENNRSADKDDARDQRLSFPDRDFERELYERHDDGRLFIEAESRVRDRLFGSSAEDRILPAYEGVDELPIDDFFYRVTEDGEEVLQLRPEVISPGGEGVPDSTGLPKSLDEYLQQEAEPEEDEDQDIAKALRNLPAKTAPQAIGGNVEWNPMTRCLQIVNRVLQMPSPKPSKPATSKPKCHKNNPKMLPVLIPKALKA